MCFSEFCEQTALASDYRAAEACCSNCCARTSRKMNPSAAADLIRRLKDARYLMRLLLRTVDYQSRYDTQPILIGE